MKTLILILTILLISIIGSSQYFFEGNVVDVNGEPLIGSSVIVSTVNDSAMVAFGMCDADGRFKINLEEKIGLFARISFIGHETKYETLDFQENSTFLLEDVVLKSRNTALQEVQIEADRIPMGMIGDTIVYDANLFHTKEGASVEDLLKKMPGIDVDRDGNIKAMGEDVGKIMVDGKEFFGGDPKIATKNLDAEAIDKVEVFDKKSEMAEFTGIDDGNEQKTINLELKEDFKKGGFGKVKLQGGTEDTYYGKLNYNRFSTSTQTSIIANSNNINERAFSFQDYIDFMGGIGNMAAFGGFESNGGLLTVSEDGGKGINTDHSVGLNLNHSMPNDISFNSSYFFVKSGNDLKNVINAQSFDENSIYNSTENQSSATNVVNHRLNTTLQWKPNPLFESKWINNFFLNKSSFRNNATTNYFYPDLTTNSVLNNLSKNDLGLNWNSRLILRKKFKKQGRSLISNFEAKYSHLEERNDFENAIFNSSLNQEQIFETPDQLYKISMAYNEQLKKLWYLGLGGWAEHNLTSPSRKFFDVVDGDLVFNESIQSDFSRALTQYDANVSLKRNSKKVKAEIGTSSRRSIIEFDGSSNKYDYLLPFANLKIDLKGAQKIELNYNSQITNPKVNQLLTIPDNTNPNRSFFGNPHLIPELQQNLSLSYNYFDNFNFSSLFLNLRLNTTRDKIVSNTDLNEDFTSISTLENSDFFQSVNAYLSFSRPFKPLKIKYNIEGDVNYSAYNSKFNGVETRTDQKGIFGKVSISNLNDEKISLRAGIRMNWNEQKYEVAQNFNLTYFNYDYFADAQISFTEELELLAAYTMRLFNDVSFSESRRMDLIDLGISYSFENKPFAIKLSCSDFLNQNIGFSRSGDVNGYIEENFNARGRFVMVGLTVKLGKKGKKED